MENFVLKIGYLVPFIVVKNLPDYDSLLVTIPAKGILAQLPKRYALKTYRVGESAWAAVFDMKGARIILSQKSPQYVRKILEYLTKDLITQGRIKFKKVAKLSSANFFKVAVQPLKEDLSQMELTSLLSPYLKNLKDYIQEKVVVIKYSKSVEEYIKNSLFPTPPSAIKRVIYIKDMESATVYVDQDHLATALGKKGRNVATARKLTGVNIELIPD